MGHRIWLGTLLQRPLLKEAALCSAGLQVTPGIDTGMTWRTWLPRFSSRLGEKRTHVTLEAFSSIWKETDRYKAHRSHWPTFHQHARAPSIKPPLCYLFQNLCLNLCLQRCEPSWQMVVQRVLAHKTSVCNICIGYQASHFCT